jgi:hypothetical protein
MILVTCSIYGKYCSCPCSYRQTEYRLGLVSDLELILTSLTTPYYISINFTESNLGHSEHTTNVGIEVLTAVAVVAISSVI